MADKNKNAPSETEREAKVKKIIVEQLICDESDVTPESDIKEDLGADSLDMVELVMVIEEEFEIVIVDADAEKIKTVSDIYKFLNKTLPPEL